MSDYRTEQDAAGFWRRVDERIEKALDARFKQQTGITPDTAYSSVMFNAFGQAIWGGAGGGGASFRLRGISQHQFTTFGEQIMTIGGTTKSSGSGLVNFPIGGVTSSTTGIKPTATGLYIAAANMVWEATGSGSRRELKIGLREDDLSSYIRIAKRVDWYDSTSWSLHQVVVAPWYVDDPDLHFVCIAEHGHTGSIKAAQSGISELSTGSWFAVIGPF